MIRPMHEQHNTYQHDQQRHQEQLQSNGTTRLKRPTRLTPVIEKADIPFTVPERTFYTSARTQGTQHTHLHDKLRKTLLELVQWHRDRLGIERAWKVNVGVLCPFESPSEVYPNAYVTWDMDTWSALVMMRCDVEQEFVLHEVLHELMELAEYRTGTLWHYVCQQLLAEGRVSSELIEYVTKEYEQARNQETNRKVDLYLSYLSSLPFGVKEEDEGSCDSKGEKKEFTL